MKKASFLLGVAGCAVAIGSLALFMPGVAQTQSYSSPMRDVDNPARQPVNLQEGITVLPNHRGGSTSVIYTVPAGKRLIIDYIGAYSSVFNGETALLIEVSAYDPNGSPTSYAIAPLTNGAPYADHNDVHPVIASQQVSMFANPGDQIVVQCVTDGGAPGAQIGASITGYLVNLP
jgi:hypothetical protein